jgi:alcohol dehydrogenase, propanol-preferring
MRGMQMSDIPSFPYSLLWHGRTICSVANFRRRDGKEFLAAAYQIPVRIEVQTYSFHEANEVLDWLHPRTVSLMHMAPIEPIKISFYRRTA